jgi:glycosyltransferase involved in cell wall biosynthesis
MSDDRPLICLFSRLRQEVVRENNVRRMLANAERYVDAGVVLDDGSTDGTADVVADWILARPGGAVVNFKPDSQELTLNLPKDRPFPSWFGLRVDPAHPERSFQKELIWKQRMLDIVHHIRPFFVYWLDGDEVLDRAGTEGLRRFCEERQDGGLEPEIAAWSLHYTQLWRSSTWARTDEGFDAGFFIKLWRWTPDLVFDTTERGPYRGLHQPQFPKQVMTAFQQGRVGRAPFEQIHYGNFGKNLTWKAIQYACGLGGVDRHLRFDRGEFRPVDPCLLPEGVEQAPELPEAHHVTPDGPLDLARFYPSRPQPFTSVEIERILALRNLRGIEDTFTVVIPTYNRADTLDRTLQSVLDQTYPKWVALIMDDGSSDSTPALMRYWQDRDPRIFYARYPENRGGVAINNVAMAISCEWTTWWTRLGSDDTFGPRKLEYDALALREADACFGAYQVSRDRQLMEVCNGPVTQAQARELLLGHPPRFMASWVNVAVRTAVLADLHARYGHFVDPRLRNMEDFLLNARIARHSRGWVWRGRWGERFLINPTAAECQAITQHVTAQRRLDELEATWTCVTTGASGDMLQTAKDDNLTLALLTQDMQAAQGITPA